jgi:hypothetical protein
VRWLSVSGEVPTSEIIYLCMILIGMLLVGTVGVSFVRKWLSRNDDTPGGGFTFSDLRQLHREGKLTDAEFERVRAKLVAKISKAGPPAGPGKNPMDGGDSMDRP